MLAASITRFRSRVRYRRHPGSGPARLGRGVAAQRRAGREGRFRAPRHGPVRPGRLQLRLLPRLVPGQGRLPPVAVRLRPGEGLRRPDPRGPRPAHQPRRPRQQPAAAQGDRPGAARRRTALRPGLLAVPASSASGSPPAPPGSKGSGDGQVDRRHPARVRLQPSPARPGSSSSRRPSPTAPTENITPFCDFRTNDDAVAEVDALGQVKALRAGDTAIIVSYRGNVLPVRVLVPMRAAAGIPAIRSVPEVNYIDREVFAKLRRLNMVPSDLSSDDEFLRRVTIDTIGTLPTPEEVRAFLADTTARQARHEDRRVAGPSAARRAVGDQVLRHHRQQHRCPGEPAAAAAEAQPDVARLVPQAPRREHALRRDRPRHPVRHQPRRPVAGGVAQAGQGARRGDADKGFDDHLCRPSQPRSVLAAAAAGDRRPVGREDGGRVPGRPPRVRPVPQAPVRPLDAGRLPGLRQRLRRGELRHLARSEEAVRRGERGTPQEGKAKAKQTASDPRGLHRQPRRGKGGSASRCRDPGHRQAAAAQGAGRARDRRAKPARTRACSCSSGCARRTTRSSPAASSTASGAITSASASSIRWTISRWPTRPPTDKLLDALAKDFIEHKYDIRQLERTILHVAHLPADRRSPTRPTSCDRNNYSHSYVRPMMAEVVVDVLERRPRRQGELRQRRAGRAAGPSRSAPAGCRTGNVAYAFRIFGRPPRTTACDCERAMEPALPQKLYPHGRPGRAGEDSTIRTTASSELLAEQEERRRRSLESCSWPR